VGHYGDFQNEIYLQALGGTLPAYPVEAGDLERAAHAAMSDRTRGYVAGGAGSERTMAANVSAFDRWRLLPRMFRAVDARDLSTTVCGTALPAPVLLAPIGVLGIVHPDAERAVARAAAGLGLPMVLSCAASTSIEDVRAELGDAPGWFQLYWPNDRGVARSLVQRAEAAGYGAIVVTLDTWQLGWRPRDLASGYLPFLVGEGIANYLSDPEFRAGLAKPPEEDPQGAVLRWIQVFADPTLTWSDLTWLREQTALPILVKGVLHADDARAALDAGVAGIVVSNHGGRQVDGSVAALDCLPAVVDAVHGRVPVLLDSGVRTGADVVKALALGAAAVLLGRPYVHGLALGGEAGVRHVLRCLLADLDINLALTGHRSPAELSPDALVSSRQLEA
jgi:isopentenyl diphosphate isomerase/L-lactate dehydrogenase-like FMN-dependent dehydrogenase